MQKSALDQAAAIRAGVLSPEELIDSTREKIAALNPALNAITWTRFEAAKQAWVKTLLALQQLLAVASSPKPSPNTPITLLRPCNG